MAEHTISHAEHEKAVEDAGWKAINIYLKSVAEAEGSEPEYIMGADEEVWSIPGERKDRTRVISYYAQEMGVDFAQVKCTRRHMCLATDAIQEVAAELAAEVVAAPDEYAEDPIAYTWPDEGWTYEDCAPDAPGAIAMYRCEVKKEPDDA